MKYNKYGDFPTNAKTRITYKIDGSEPKIEFEYPDNERQLKSLHRTSGIIFLALILAALTIVFVVLFFFNTNKMLSGDWVVSAYPTDSKQTLSVIGIISLFVIIFLVLIFFYSKIITMIVIRTNWGKKFYPRYNKFIHKKSYSALFTECPENLQIELPLFSNIYLDYETADEFAEYLSEVEIKEHDFKYLYRGKDVPNVYLWKAIFKFRRQPKKGFIKINFT